MTRHRPGFYVLGFAAAILLAGILINMITATLPQPAAEATGSATTDLESRVASLEDAIDLHLEELRVHEEHILALEALQWTRPERVTQVVAQRLWERATSCQNDDACYYGDSVLVAFYYLPYEERHDYAVQLASQGNWSAQQVSEADWLVSAQLGNDNFNFLANSTDHLVCWYELEWCKE